MKNSNRSHCESCLNSSFILHSSNAWKEDARNRFNLEKLNASFHESVPVLKFVDWKIISIKRGYAETVLPLNPNSSNQYITHQAALMLLSADYTGGAALASLFHSSPVVGFQEGRDGYGIYMWGLSANIKWIYPSCDDLVCRASIPEESWEVLYNRMNASKKVAFTVRVEMFNGNKLVAECDFSYWAQDTINLRRDAFNIEKISILYQHKLRTTAKLIAGLRALEQESSSKKFSDPFATILAGKHGTTLAKRFLKTIPQIQNMVSARTVHLDMAVLKFSQDNQEINVVNIGSGYDSRFWRLDIKNATIYELDLPLMLEDRKKIFNYKKRGDIKTVEIDLNFQKIDEVLSETAVGFDKSKPTFFIWEGGSMYFNDVDIEKIFSSISKIMSKDSKIWFDYVDSAAINDKTGIKEIEDFMQNMRIMGEAFIFGFNNVESLAKKYSLNLSLNISSSDLIRSSEPHYNYYNFCILTK